ncbi:bifunctional aspartate kinase/diaminopimelate decarboxylase [Marinihelvus fidelis]|nr:bifunctional aspartate kinase/diaminopimelate decarboxylase [Marinihelvus fidelis]
MSQELNGWRVLKFGGTSVANPAGWDVICGQVEAASQAGQNVLVVLSALSGVTNALTALCDAADPGGREALLGDIGDRHRALCDALDVAPGDAFNALMSELRGPLTARLPLDSDAARAELLGYGERLSTTLAIDIMAARGQQPLLQDARQLLRASGEHDSPLSASCDASADPAMADRLAAQGAVHVTQGFLVGGPGGATWLLGRGGSDTSAATLAARLSADPLEIWTDVPGIFTADPRLVPDARLLLDLSYGEAQELASMGAKVLHPPSVRICKEAGVPLHIRDTTRPAVRGTAVGPRSPATEAGLKGIVHRGNITLVMMENPAMWRQVGFLAAAFGVFRDHGLSIDLISTSESSVTVSLDPGRHGAGSREVLAQLTESLSKLCTVQVVTGCVSVSLVGNQIRTILGRLSEALDVLHDRKVYMVTQSANDLNLTLVVEAESADRLVQHLHQTLVAQEADTAPGFGDSWRELTGPVDTIDAPWWQRRAEELLALSRERGPLYVYDVATVEAAAGRLTALNHVDRVLYAMKANNHPEILRALHAAGVGFDCVSVAEIEHIHAVIPGIDPAEVLFTPNFSGQSEYEKGFELGARVTVDNAWPLRQWTETFAGRDVFLRVDLAFGHGHHSKVVTSGARSKFGIEMAQLESLAALAREHDIRVVGLHAHTGSGVHTADVWSEQLKRLLALRELFPAVKVIDLGGGLGVPERPGQPVFDLAAMDAAIGTVEGRGDVQVWIEPGRYLVAESGVLVAPVTQVKEKGSHRYLGLATGMNSLIRPALYDAHHEIINLDRLGDPASCRYTVVGPICESGDILGEARHLPESTEGDIMLIANAGAYGRTMSSRYNLREPAAEVVI